MHGKSRKVCKLSADLQVAAGVVAFTPGLVGETPGKNGRVIPGSIGTKNCNQSTSVSQVHGLSVLSAFCCFVSPSQVRSQSLSPKRCTHMHTVHQRDARTVVWPLQVSAKVCGT